MSAPLPKVSIGLPVFNGEQFLKEALNSILGQTFTDFELIISDNASTDQTSAICQSYASQDSRIRYHRNETNIGGAKNHNLTVQMSRGLYFHWAAYDDVCAPELIEKCVAYLDDHPDIVITCAETVDIDENGSVIGQKRVRVGESDTPHRRLLEISKRNHPCEVVYGVIRSDTLKMTRLLQDYTDSDRTLLCELGLRGKFHQIQAPLFFKRYHPKNTILEWQTRMAWFDAGLIGKISLPNWLQIADLFATIRRVKISNREKFLCYLCVLGPVIGWNRRELFRDLKFALAMSLHSASWRNKRFAKSMNW